MRAKGEASVSILMIKAMKFKLITWTLSQKVGVCIAWYKHERGWVNSRQLCKPETKSRVCVTVENSPNPLSVYIRLCKHRKKVFCCLYKTTFLRKNAQLFVTAVSKREILTSRKVLYTKSCTRNGFCFAKRCFPKYWFFSLKMSA